MTQNAVHIRGATINDVPSILTLLRELVSIDEPAQFIEDYGTSLLEHGFGTPPCFKILVAELDGNIVGFLRYTCAPLDLGASKFINLKDLVVSRTTYRRGVAQALMRQMTEMQQRSS